MSTNKDINEFDALRAEVLSRRAARLAARENDMRRAIARSFESAREDQALSLRELASGMDTSLSQVQRLLHEDVGGSVTLRSICSAADVLNLRISVHVRPVPANEGCLFQLGSVVWESSEYSLVEGWTRDPAEGAFRLYTQSLLKEMPFLTIKGDEAGVEVG